MKRPRANIMAAVLAAGGSRRMGRPKQLVSLGGETLIRRAARAAGDVAEEVVVIVPPGAREIRAELRDVPVDAVPCPDCHEGIGASLRLAVSIAQARGSAAALVLLVDQPFVTSSHLRRLVDRWAGGGHLAAATRYDDGPGVPAVFDRHLFPVLAGVEGDVGARTVLRDLPPNSVAIEDGDPRDVDTPSDLAELETAMTERS